MGIYPTPNIADKIKNGALILDVRSSAEFENNNIRGAVNIPLNTLSKKLNKLKKDKVIITFCASGI